MIRLADGGRTCSFREALDRLPPNARPQAVGNYEAILDGTLVPRAEGGGISTQPFQAGADWYHLVVAIERGPGGYVVGLDVVMRRDELAARILAARGLWAALTAAAGAGRGMPLTLTGISKAIYTELDITGMAVAGAHRRHRRTQGARVVGRDLADGQEPQPLGGPR